MTWTFTPDFTLIRDQIRQMIGDVVVTDPLLTDEAIAFFYARAGNDILAGSILAARSAAAKLALEFDRDMDGLKTNRSQRHKAVLDTITQLEAEQVAGNFAFTAPSIGNVADAENYPLCFEHSDIAGPE